MLPRRSRCRLLRLLLAASSRGRRRCGRLMPQKQRQPALGTVRISSLWCLAATRINHVIIC